MVASIVPLLPPDDEDEDEDDEEEEEEDDEDDEAEPLADESYDFELRLRKTRLMDDTLGMLSSLQTDSFNSRSRISHANIDGHSRL